MIRPLLIAFALTALSLGPAHAERIKDLASVAGVRSNALVGYGLVVGLDGTGDSTTQAPFTTQSLAAMLSQMGVVLPPGVNPQLKNVAAVAIHAELPAFAKPGQRIDITVSSIGNAKSLRGGSLLMSPLRGADGQVYAVAQGSMVVGGFGAQGRDGSRVQVNVSASGRIPNGATVERVVANSLSGREAIHLNLHQGDFRTAQRIVRAINSRLGGGLAEAVDAVTVAVRAPRSADQTVAFIAALEDIEVIAADAPARVVVNARTGTVVIGQNVRVSPAAVTHGSLSVTIRENPQVSQPNPFGQGDTAVVPDSEIEISQGDGRMFKLEGTTTLDSIVRAVNSVGAAPGDLVAILEALKQAGALRAELVVI
ncbi:MAG: flagellar basal body P-ring protein FlgI [Oceanococcaceae bacterium]